MIAMRFQYLSLEGIWLYVIVMAGKKFRLNPQSLVVWMLSILLLEAGAKSEV